MTTRKEFDAKLPGVRKPAGYGTLVAVLQVTPSERELWFQHNDEPDIIRSVTVDVLTGKCKQPKTIRTSATRIVWQAHAFAKVFSEAMQYHIKLMQSEEGWSVSCPALPGCHSQGATRDEAIDNIKIAIREWLEVEAEEAGLLAVEEMVVTVWSMPKLPDISHTQAVRVFGKIGFRIAREGKHTIMTNRQCAPHYSTP
jgi:predicted RNase H-like HicB family nuclease